MKSILIIAIAALTIVSFLAGRYLLKDLMRLFWKYSTNLFADHNTVYYGELGVTIVIVVLLGLGAAVVQSAAAALFALITTNDIAKFCMTFRGVFSFHSSEIQSPSQHVLWLFVSPVFKLLAIGVLIWSVRAYFSSFNKRFRKTIFSESDCFYFSMMGVVFMFGLQVVLLTQSIDRLNMVFNCFNVILQNLSYFVYFFSVYWTILLKSSGQLTKNTDKFLIMGEVEKKIVSTPWKVLVASYAISVVLTLPSYLGLQWQRNNLILISLLAIVVICATFLTKKVFSKSWNYLATIMFDSTLENPIHKTMRKEKLDSRWHYALYALMGIVVVLFTVFFPKSMFMFLVMILFLVITTIIAVLMVYGITLLIGMVVTSIRRENQAANDNCFEDFTFYFKNILASSVQPLLMGSGIVFLVFLFITVFPKSVDCSDIYMSNISVVDPTGEVLMIDDEHPHYSVPIDYKEIPNEFIKLLILNEDRGFFNQNSYLPNKSNWHGLSPAILKRGGSNINCQIVKQLTFKDASGYPRDGMRKISDQLGSYQLSLKYDCEQLIELYSNISSFNGGRGPLGLNAAALYTFGRPIARLNSLEMCYLISTLPRSSYLTDGKNKIAYMRVHEEPELTKNILLQKVKKWDAEHLITKREYWQFCDDSLRFTNTRYVCDIPKGTRIMLKKKFKDNPSRHDCTITLDNEKALMSAYNLLKTKDAFRKAGTELQVAAFIVEAQSGKIVGHFSSSEVLDYAKDYTYPIGSLGKPAIVLELLKSGASQDFTLFDGKKGQRKTPHNSHGCWSNKFVGVETILSKSLNGPFANIADLGLNPRKVFQSLEKDYSSMDIDKDTVCSNDPYNYPLGIREMRVYDIAQLYQTIFNDGLFIPLSLEQNADTVQPKRIWDENHVRTVKNALHQTIKSDGGTLNRYKKDLPQVKSFYGKTGTSSKQRDGWTVLSDGNIVIVCWASYGKQFGGKMVLGQQPLWGANTAGLFAVLVYNELVKSHGF